MIHGDSIEAPPRVVRGVAAGTNPKVVSEALGHKDIQITLDRYSHALPTLQAKAMARLRAEKLDECLDILELAWTGEPVSYAGAHYQMTDLLFLPRPVQRPRIPIWTVGAWPHARSLARSARWDGCVVYDMSGSSQEGEVSAETVRRVKAWMDEHRSDDAPFEIIVEGETSGTDAEANRAILEPLIDAGATWWIESRWEDHESFESLLHRIRDGPPGV